MPTGAASCVASTPGGGVADLLKLTKVDLDRALGPFKDQIKAQMRSRASVYTSTGAKSLGEAEEERAEGKLQELRRLFNEIDTDGSGAIDKDELRAMLIKLGKPSSDAMLERAMAAMDPDGDGEITFDEFKQFWGQDGSGVDRLAKMEQAVRAQAIPLSTSIGSWSARVWCSVSDCCLL